MRYGLDTLLASLMILEKMEFKLNEGKERLIAATVLQTSAKIHEYKTPTYSQLIAWGSHSFTKE